MGMRTIRWRNGQCPRRNGQWAERIAHAGSEAVRLVPFCEAEELSSASLFFLIAEYCVSAWRLPLCRDAGRIIMAGLKQIKGNYGRSLKEAAGGPHSPRLGSYPVMEAGRRGPSVAERVARPEVELGPLGCPRAWQRAAETSHCLQGRGQAR